MRKIILSGITLGLLATASSLSAQSSGSWIGSLGGGVSLPVGDFGDAAKTGYHGGATLGYRPADSKIDLLVDATYHHFTAKGVANGHDNLFIALGRANYWAGDKLYLIGGAGVMRDEFSNTVVGVTTKSTESVFAITGGLGVALNNSIFLEARAIDGFTKGAATLMIPVTIGVRF
jgi:hypothetical protein